VGAKKANTLNGLQGPGQAVPTGKAHRLPKSGGYVSTRPRQVKQKWPKNRDFEEVGEQNT
jgi:hypothetical protein